MTGDDLRKAILTPPIPMPALFEEFLYTQCAIMLTGETGKGKSVIAANIALALSSGTPLFGTLKSPQPRRVYYLQLEGNPYEQYRRLYFMQTVIPLNADNLYWDADRRHHLLANVASSSTAKYDQIAKAFPTPPDLIIIDPIYKAVMGDVAKADPAQSIVQFSDRLMGSFPCGVLLIHHPHRERFTNAGKPLDEEDTYYGHSFLKFHVEVSYAFKSLDVAGSMGELILKKRREDNVLPQIRLQYHPETYTCSMLPRLPTLEKQAQVELFLRQHPRTDFYEVQSACQVSTTFLRELQSKFIAQGVLTFERTPGKRNIWLVTFP